MYINILNDLVVDYDDIVCFFDTDNTTQTVLGGKYLIDAQNDGRLIDLSKNSLPRSFLVVKNKETNNETVYLLSLTTQKILKTIKKGKFSE